VSKQDGREVLGVDRRQVPPTTTIGVGGTAIYGGFVQEGEKDSRLVGREKYKTFSDILANIPIVATGVRYFLNLVSKAEWKVQPPEGSGDEGQALADLVQEMLHDMGTPWHRVVRRAAMYRFYGFNIQEWTAKRRDDGAIGLLDVEPRPQITIERWDTDRTGQVLGAIQRSPQTQEEIYLPREKIVYVVDDSLSDSPEGLGLFRHIVEAAHRLRRYEQLEGFGYEGNLRGIPIGRAPLAELDRLVKAKQLTQAEANDFLKGLTDFLKNHIRNPSLGILLDSKTYTSGDESKNPSGRPHWDLTLLDGGEYSLAEVAEAIKRVVFDIARILGIEHLLMGDGKAGSFALSKDKSHNFGLIVDSTMKELREQFTKDILRPLWDLNGWDPKLMPTFKTEMAAYRDVEQLSSVLRDLGTVGVTLDREDEAVQELFDLVGLSRLVPRAMQLISPMVEPEPETSQSQMPEEEEEEEEEEE
jgi:hypothetical protein